MKPQKNDSHIFPKNKNIISIKSKHMLRIDKIKL